MLTATQQQAAWQSVAKALRDGKHCAADVAEERARNIVMALSDTESTYGIATTIEYMLATRGNEIGDLPSAVNDAYFAYIAATHPEGTVSA